MLINIGDLLTIKSFLQKEFMDKKHPDMCIKLAACIELIDLLPYKENGFQIHYGKILDVMESKGKLTKNEIFY